MKLYIGERTKPGNDTAAHQSAPATEFPGGRVAAQLAGPLRGSVVVAANVCEVWHEDRARRARTRAADRRALALPGGLQPLPRSVSPAGGQPRVGDDALHAAKNGQKYPGKSGRELLGPAEVTRPAQGTQCARTLASARIPASVHGGSHTAGGGECAPFFDEPTSASSPPPGAWPGCPCRRLRTAMAPRCAGDGKGAAAAAAAAATASRLTVRLPGCCWRSHPSTPGRR